MSTISDESRYRILKLLEANPEISQRELAREMGISLGKVNYCLKALIEKGIIKAKRFTKSHNKKAYTYYLTHKGIDDKARITFRFLKQKQTEYELLLQELEELRNEVKQMSMSEEEGD